MRARHSLLSRLGLLLFLWIFSAGPSIAGTIAEDASSPGTGSGGATSGTVVEDAARTCGNAGLTLSDLEVIEEATRTWSSKPGGPVIQAVVTVPVAFHVIRSSDGLSYDVTNQQLNDQIDVLNNAYAGTSFQFSLLSIDRTNNSTWTNCAMDSPDEISMTSALVVSSATTLNFYVRNLPTGLGHARIPSWYATAPNRDGVHVLYRCLPGGNYTNRNLGHVGTHEVGHWLGLLHTFENWGSGSGCSPGDNVSDTPAEDSPASGCPTGRDTCPSAGVDPIHNYMDYTDDACQNEVTAGQSARMNVQVAFNRPALARPQTITDAVFGAGRTTGALTWTAPEDVDGGQVSAYDIRYSTAPITTQTEWDWATSIWPNIPTPQAPGNTECVELNLSSCTWYYWAIKSQGDIGAWSLISNSPGAKTKCGTGSEILCLFAPSGPVSDRLELPQALAIGQIAPNPARSPVNISLAIPADHSGEDVRLAVFDVTGRQIRTIEVGPAEPGFHSVDWDLRDSAGQEAANGVYFVRVAVGNVTESRRVLLAR